MLTDEQRADSMGQATREKLRQFIARIERVEAEQSELAADKREVYAEVKTFGFDTGILRTVIAKRKKDAATLAEEEALLDMYMEVAESGVSDAPEAPPITVRVVLVDLDRTSKEYDVPAIVPMLQLGGVNYALQHNNVYKQVV